MNGQEKIKSLQEVLKHLEAKSAESSNAMKKVMESSNDEEIQGALRVARISMVAIPQGGTFMSADVLASLRGLINTLISLLEGEVALSSAMITLVGANTENAKNMQDVFNNVGKYFRNEQTKIARALQVASPAIKGKLLSLQDELNEFATIVNLSHQITEHILTMNSPVYGYLTSNLETVGGRFDISLDAKPDEAKANPEAGDAVQRAIEDIERKLRETPPEKKGE